jgi:protein-S-isoprenylcysteine O-methyltransferase Ste14
MLGRHLAAWTRHTLEASMLKVALRLLADAALVGTALFVSAGTLAWPRAWVLLAVLLLVRTIGAIAVYRVNPELLRDRAGLPVHAEQPRADRVLLLGVLATGFLGTPAVAGLDAFHWHLLPGPARPVAGFGLLLFALGWALKSLALYANAFAVAAVRVQRERAHAVADSGVYRVVRHPFYAADPLIFAGLALWLGSYTAALTAVVPVALMVLRLRLEERVLQRELPGYAAYAARVRHRLVPGVW